MTYHPQHAELARFGHRIRERRRRCSISQEELAEKAGVHRTYIGMIERGEKNVTLLTMPRMANALGISLSELFRNFENGE